MKEQLQAFTPLRSVSQRHLDSITSASGKRNCYSSEDLQTETWCPTDRTLAAERTFEKKRRQCSSHCKKKNRLRDSVWQDFWNISAQRKPAVLNTKCTIKRSVCPDFVRTILTSFMSSSFGQVLTRCFQNFVVFDQFVFSATNVSFHSMINRAEELTFFRFIALMQLWYVSTHSCHYHLLTGEINHNIVWISPYRASEIVENKEGFWSVKSLISSISVKDPSRYDEASCPSRPSAKDFPEFNLVTTASVNQSLQHVWQDSETAWVELFECRLTLNNVSIFAFHCRILLQCGSKLRTLKT